MAGSMVGPSRFYSTYHIGGQSQVNTRSCYTKLLTCWSDFSPGPLSLGETDSRKKVTSEYWKIRPGEFNYLTWQLEIFRKGLLILVHGQWFIHPYIFISFVSSKDCVWCTFRLNHCWNFYVCSSWIP